METETQKTTRDFCEMHAIKARCEYKGRESDEDAGKEWKHDSWRVTLTCASSERRHKTRLTVPFKMGVGLNGKQPEAAEVLDCLVMDAWAKEESFEDWCANYGYDTDSRKAERMYKECLKTAANLERFLGADLLADLQSNFERL